MVDEDGSEWKYPLDRIVFVLFSNISHVNIMREKIFLFCSFAVFLITSFHCSNETPITNDSIPAITFEKMIDLGRTDISYDVKPTSDGGYVVAGEIESKQTLHIQALLMKLDRRGNQIWLRTFDEMNQAISVVETRDKGFLVLGSKLLRTDSLGMLESSHDLFANDVIEYRQMIACHDGGAIISSEVSRRDQPQLSRVTRVDDFGRMIWTHDYGSSEYGNAIWRMSRTFDGNYFFMRGSNKLVGTHLCNTYFMTKIDRLGKPLIEIEFDSTANTSLEHGLPSFGGNHVITGSQRKRSDVKSDFYLAMIDSKGKIIRESTVDFSTNATAMEIVYARGGGYFVLGQVHAMENRNDAADACLVKFDFQGNLQWKKIYAGLHLNRLLSIEATDDGGVIMAGYTNSTDAHSDIWIMKTDVNGNIR